MAMKGRAARHLTYPANAALDAGAAEAGQLASLAKCYASDVAMEVSLAAVDVSGGNGYSRNYPVERFMRDAKVTQLYEEANSIERVSKTLKGR